MKVVEGILNVVLRVIFGILGIIGFNSLLAWMGIAGSIGINGVTLSAVGVLGIPGYLLLCGMALV